MNYTTILLASIITFCLSFGGVMIDDYSDGKFNLVARDWNPSVSITQNSLNVLGGTRETTLTQTPLLYPYAAKNTASVNMFNFNLLCISSRVWDKATVSISYFPANLNLNNFDFFAIEALSRDTGIRLNFEVSDGVNSSFSEIYLPGRYYGLKDYTVDINSFAGSADLNNISKITTTFTGEWAGDYEFNSFSLNTIPAPTAVYSGLVFIILITFSRRRKRVGKISFN